MYALASAIADQAGDPWLSRTHAQTVLAPIWPERSAEKLLIDALISQGLLEEDVVPDGSPYGTDIVAITFERIGHHLMVSGALAGVSDAADIAAELGGRLGRVIGVGATIDLGLLEATSVVVAGNDSGWSSRSSDPLSATTMPLPRLLSPALRGATMPRSMKRREMLYAELSDGPPPSQTH